jgi:hypothetical protein
MPYSPAKASSTVRVEKPPEEKAPPPVPEWLPLALVGAVVAALIAYLVTRYG